jgi:glyoxylase-like metal-dependent hydrolase (beta-lactamase superfamily II)
MKVTDHIHALKTHFQLVFSPERIVDRSVYVYIVFGDRIHLIDCGVKGAQQQIFDYVEANGRSRDEIETLVISHSHPDHIGAAVSVKEITGCKIAYHEAERDWIENTEKQYKERPLPGFHDLVEGPVAPDIVLKDGEMLKLENGLELKVYHTPGHSRGSVSLFLEKEGSLVTADALPLPGDLPLYEDIADSIASIKMMQSLAGIKTVFSSWEDPIQDPATIKHRMNESLQLFYKIHQAVCTQAEPGLSEIDLCKKVVTALSLPPVAVNPIMAKAFASSVKHCGNDNFIK